MEQVKSVWNFGPQSPTKEQADLLLWWVDIFLPKIAGSEWYDEDHRYYKLLSDECTYKKFPREAVPASTEAFAMACFENCCEKWILQFEYLDDNPTAAIPRGKGNEAYEDGKWSTPRMGQKAYGGWKDGGVDAFVAYDNQMVAFREEEEKNGKVRQQFALSLMRSVHGKTANSAVEEGKKRRKKASSTPAEAPKPKKIIRRKDK